MRTPEPRRHYLLTATLTLALGVGANTAIFSVVNGVLLAPLPYPDSDRVVLVQEDEPDADPGTTGYFAFDAIRAEQQAFDGIAMYFQAMRLPLLRGRPLDESDRQTAAPVAVIGQTMAAQLWPNEDPIGKRIRVAGGDNNPTRTIVGVVGDVRHYGLHLPATLQVYVPHDQTHYPQPALAVVVRTPGDPLLIASAVREVVRAVDPL